MKLVGGIPIPWKANVGILFERRHYWSIAKNYLNVSGRDVVSYDATGWDREILRYKHGDLVIAMTYASGASYSASAVERFVRTGVSLIIRVGSCGSLSSNLKKWDLLVIDSAIAHEAVTSFFDSKVVTGYVPRLGRLPIEERIVYGNDIITNKFFNILNFESKDMDFKVVKGRVYTNSTRYLEDKHFMSLLAKRGVLGVDMESSAIYSVAKFHDLSVVGVNIAMDEPVKFTNNVSNNFKSSFHGVTDHDDYKVIIPMRIQFVIQSILIFLTQEFRGM